MIEEIKLLLPLLQQATNTGIWLVVAMIAKEILLHVFFGSLFLYAGLRVLRVITGHMDAYRIILGLHQKMTGDTSRFMTVSEFRSLEKALQEKGLL